MQRQVRSVSHSEGEKKREGAGIERWQCAALSRDGYDTRGILGTRYQRNAHMSELMVYYTLFEEYFIMESIKKVSHHS